METIKQYVFKHHSLKLIDKVEAKSLVEAAGKVGIGFLLVCINK
jgi:hypothetical protein